MNSLYVICDFNNTRTSFPHLKVESDKILHWWSLHLDRVRQDNHDIPKVNPLWNSDKIRNKYFWNLKHPPICDLEWDHNTYPVKVPGKRLEQKFNASFLFFVFCLYNNISTFKHTQFTYSHQVILIDILPKKTKNGLKSNLNQK